MRFPRLLAMVLTLAAIAAISCSDDDKVTSPSPDPPGPTYLARTSPGNVLANLVTAYRARDIDRYEEGIADGFIFKTSDSDNLGFEELNREQDRASTANMFAQVQSIALRLDIVDPEPSDFLEYPGAEGYLRVPVPFVRIEVLTRTLIDGDPLIFLVAGDPALFIFEPDSTVTPVTYKIVYQQDLHGSRLPSPEMADAVPDVTH